MVYVKISSNRVSFTAQFRNAFFCSDQDWKAGAKKITKTAIVTLETKFFDGSRRGLLKFPKISHSSFYGCVPK